MILGKVSRWVRADADCGGLGVVESVGRVLCPAVYDLRIQVTKRFLYCSDIRVFEIPTTNPPRAAFSQTLLSQLLIAREVFLVFLEFNHAIQHSETTRFFAQSGACL